MMYLRMKQQAVWKRVEEMELRREKMWNAPIIQNILYILRNYKLVLELQCEKYKMLQNFNENIGIKIEILIQMLQKVELKLLKEKDYR